MTVGDAVDVIRDDVTIRFGYLYGGDSPETSFGINVEFEAMWFSSIFNPFRDLTVKQIVPVDSKTIEMWVSKYDYEDRLKAISSGVNETEQEL